MMCQFFSFTPQLLPFLLAGKREGGLEGSVTKGWREEGDCALPKVKLACVGRG